MISTKCKQMARETEFRCVKVIVPSNLEIPAHPFINHGIELEKL